MMKWTNLLAVVFILPAVAVASDVAILGETVYPVAGEPIEDGVVLIRDGRIKRVGPESRVRLPEDMRTLKAVVVTPGFVDARSTVGLSGVYGGRSGQVRDQDQLDTTEAVQPQLDPIDAYNTEEPLVDWVRRYGVTTLHTGHGPGAVISGRTMIVKTRGDIPEAALVRPDTAIAITLGPRNARNFASPGTRAKSVAMLRAAFTEANDYARKQDSDDPPGRDIGKEVLLRVLDGDIKAMITAHSVTEIAAALRLQREFGFGLLVDGGADAHLMTGELKAAGVPVLLHAPRLRARGETKNASFAAAAALHEAGIPFAFETGFESYVPKSRVLLFEVMIAVANGLPPAAALEAMTLSPARILGIDDIVGSLEKGKHGDVVLFDGDPFEYTSHVCGVVIEGEVVSEDCR